MINTDEFVKRLEMLFEHYGLSAASFADKIGVQRSGVSHLLSGRNKPSLDFVMKILHYFPEVDLYWLLNGKGTMVTMADRNAPIRIAEKPFPEMPLKGTAAITSGKEIAKIIVLHSDGSFSEYKPEK